MAIRLSDRDIEIMLALARNGFLNIKQIQRKWFKGYKYCAERLKRLKDEKYLDVVYIERFGSGNFYLQKRGMEYINDYYGTEYKPYAKSMKINHFLSCGEFYLNFPQTIFQIEEYEMEYQLDNLISDIYVKYYDIKNNDKLTDLLVEIDNTNRVSNIKEKIRSYNKCYENRKWKDQFDFFPKCLIVTDCKITKELRDSLLPIKFISYGELVNRKLIDIL